MKKFICVRMIQANGVDLSLLQFDYDQTFAVFFLNADLTIYGRYGSRTSEKDSTREMSLAGFNESMRAALALHREYPANKAALVGKQGRPPRYATPEQYPELKKYKSTLATEGRIVPSCIHCHQVRDAERTLLRQAGQPFPPEELFAYPMPDLLGLRLDPQTQSRIEKVTAGSAAARAGFQPGDELITLEGQPIVSTADVQWVLQHAPAPGKLRAEVQRAGARQDLTLELAAGWREGMDIAFRATSWDLRRMASGGLVLEDLPDDERAKLKIDPAALALRVEYVGEYGEHAAGKKAGFKADDVIVSLDGLTRRLGESQWFAHVTRQRKKGEKVQATVLRGGQRVNLELPMQ